jgi:uncharacterized membrane protein YfcA
MELSWVSVVVLHALFFGGAFLFAAVGMGGASLYIPLMYIFGYDLDTVPTTCLLLNLTVAAISLFNFRRYFVGRYFWPFAVASIPAAYVGGLLNVPETAFVLIVVAVLSITAWRLFAAPGVEKPGGRLTYGQSIAAGLPIGGAMGFVSGIIGIGGGIFLSPLLLMAKLVTPRNAAAVAAAFIIVNSASALVAHLAVGDPLSRATPTLLAVTVAGGQLGGRLGARRLPPGVMQKVLAAVVTIVAAKMVASLVGWF